MILDTSFLIDLMSSEEGAIQRAHRLEIDHVPQRVPTMVVYELFVGVGHTNRTDSEIDRIEGVIESRSVVEVDERTMRKAGRIRGRLQSEGRPVGTGDVIIGATGVVRDEPVLTRNEEDFQRIPDLQIRTY